MSRVCVAAAVTCLALGAGLAHGQEQEPHSARAYCLKVPSGQFAELEALVRDAGIPAEKQRIAAGESTGFDLLRGVVPLGSSARCDYIAVFHYGLLPEAEPGDTLLDHATKAGVEGEAAMKRWSELTELVSVQWWWFAERVGPAWPRGSYIHVNHYQLNEDATFQDYLASHRMYWKPIVERLLADGRKVSWDDVGIWRPFEADSHQAVTLDVFHDWETMMTHQGYIFDDGGIWSEVHPNTTLDQMVFHMSRIRKQLGDELFRVVATTTE